MIIMILGSCPKNSQVSQLTTTTNNSTFDSLENLVYIF